MGDELNLGSRFIVVLVTLTMLSACSAAIEVDSVGDFESANAQVNPIEEASWWEGADSCDGPKIETFDSIDGTIREPSCRTDGQDASEALAESMQLSRPELCEVPENSRERTLYSENALITGFPRQSHNISPVGDHKVSVVPVQFSDLSGTESQLLAHREQVEKFADYYLTVSNGLLKIEVDMFDTWLTLPGAQADYSVNAAEYRDSYGARIIEMREKWMKDGVLLADPLMDFTGTDTIIFVLPENQTALEATLQAFYGGDLRYKGQSAEGEIRNLFVIGMPGTPMRMYWAYYVHETGHTLSLPDWYSFNFGDTDQFGNTIGPMSTYDMMSSNWGPSLTMSSWTRWLAGWLSENQFFCSDIRDFEDSSFELINVDSELPGLKAVMIRTSENTALVIESRRENSFDEGPTSRSRDGVLVYQIDTTLAHGEGALSLVLPEGRGLIHSYPNASGEPSLDAILYLGNSVTHSGLKVTVNSSGEQDTVSISRIE
jgi:M6 family metalloprotease-like protein